MSHKECSEYPWYYRDVPTAIIVAFVALVAVTTVAIEFRPIRIAPPVTVVAPRETAPPWKAPLPEHLPQPSFPTIPPPPVISAPVASHSATDVVLPQGVSVPEAPAPPQP